MRVSLVFEYFYWLMILPFLQRDSFTNPQNIGMTVCDTYYLMIAFHGLAFLANT